MYKQVQKQHQNVGKSFSKLSSHEMNQAMEQSPLLGQAEVGQNTGNANCRETWKPDTFKTPFHL